MQCVLSHWKLLLYPMLGIQQMGTCRGGMRWRLRELHWPHLCVSHGMQVCVIPAWSVVRLQCSVAGMASNRAAALHGHESAAKKNLEAFA